MRLSPSILFSILAGLTMAKVYFEERFSDEAALTERWRMPYAPLKNKAGEEIPMGKWELSNGTLKTTEDSRFYELTCKLPEPFNNAGKDLILQLSVRHPQFIDCGGGYLKLLGKDAKLDTFHNETPYLLMFGPDICGTERKVHVILSHKGNNYQIKKNIPATNDLITHLYTLIIRPDQTYEVHVDMEKVAYGSIAEDWDILAPKRISDPNAKKPEDWEDQKEIDDPEDVKPADWDNEPPFIQDKNAKKPADWDEEMDGQWKAPVRPNPDYKGDWKPRKIKNPKYKGKWEAPMIDNPDYKFDDRLYVLGDIAALGFDLWQVKSGSLFDNILLTDSLEYAEQAAEAHWRPLYEKEKAIEEEEARRHREKAEKEFEEQKKKAASKSSEESNTNVKKDEKELSQSDDDDEPKHRKEEL